MEHLQHIKVSQVLDLIPEEDLAVFGELTQVDKSVKKLFGRLIFSLLVYSSIKYTHLSTRILEEVYNSSMFEFLTQKENHQTKHSSIADRIKAINPEYFDLIYNSLLEKISQITTDEPQQRPVTCIDSTLIGIGAGLVKWGIKMGPKTAEGKTKKYLKLTVSLYKDIPVRAKIHHTQTMISENLTLGEAVLDASSESILLFDRGLRKRKVFDQLCDKNSFFVTRASRQVYLATPQTHSEVDGEESGSLTLLSDQTGRLLNRTSKRTTHRFRLIKAVNDKEEDVSFLTNIMDMKASEIVEIYKRRWDIELFFKFLKQELELCHFLSNDLNGVKVTIYAKLITATLLAIYKKMNQLNGYKIPKVKFTLELEEEIAELMAMFKAAEILKKHGIDPKSAFG